MTDYTEKARNICRPSYSGASRVDDAQHVEDVATALREAHEAGVRRAAEIARQRGELRAVLAAPAKEAGHAE